MLREGRREGQREDKINPALKPSFSPIRKTTGLSTGSRAAPLAIFAEAAESSERPRPARRAFQGGLSRAKREISS